MPRRSSDARARPRISPSASASTHHQERRQRDRVEVVHLPVQGEEPRQQRRRRSRRARRRSASRGRTNVRHSAQPSIGSASHHIAGVPISITALTQLDCAAAGDVVAVGVVVQHRPQAHRPRPRLRLPRVLVARRVGQALVELEHVAAVVPQRPQRVGHERERAAGADLVADRVPVDAGLAGEPRPSS